MIAAPDVVRFRDVIAASLGLYFDDTRLKPLAEVLRRRLIQHNLATESYLHDLEGRFLKGEEAVLAQELTVGETYFFRNREQFSALAECVIPRRLRANADIKALRILSAGCASGEEAYSIAIQLRNVLPQSGWDIEIRGVDVNPAALERAARGRYSEWSLRATPIDVQQKWFQADGREWLLDDTVRASVSFAEHNLIKDDPVLWQKMSFDVIFCRNVIMYFSPEQAQALLRRIARSLRPGGYLFLGHAENARGLSEAFHLHQSHETFYYECKGKAALGISADWRAAVGSISVYPDVSGRCHSWEDLRVANDRVTAALPISACAEGSEPARVSGWELPVAFDLLRSERYVEALAVVHRVPADKAHDPELLLLTAALLLHSGQIPAAEAACRRLLLLDEMNAGAHYVLALCREALGDGSGAIEHDRVASYLDAGFAMPRLHLGLLAKRAGEVDRARREIGQAMTLLRQEDASRLLLFGGGFSRNALLTICEAALGERTGRP